jgi:hypothetical protein
LEKSNLAQNKKPLYQPWNEDSFQSDLFVRVMTPIQRWMYRALLQAAFFHGTRPYLPSDEKLLWILAGCETRKQWDEHKEAVLDCFEKIEIDGEILLANKRVVSDWNKLQEYRDKRSDAGAAGAAARWQNDGEPIAESKADAKQEPGARLLTCSSNVAAKCHSNSKSESKETETETEKETNTDIEKQPSVCDSFSNIKTETGDWNNIRPRYRQVFGNKPDKTRFGSKYMAACKQFGEEVVLACFETWAPDGKDWVDRDPSVKNPLNGFFKKLPELAVEEVADREQQAEEAARQQQLAAQQSAESAVVEQNVAVQKAADWEFMNKEPPPENGADPDEFMAELAELNK